MAANMRAKEPIDLSVTEAGFIPCFKKKLVKHLRKKLPSDAAVEETRILFNALADRARLKILCAMREGEEISSF